MNTKAISQRDAVASADSGGLNVTSLAPRGVRFGFVAGACWIALGVESIARPRQENYRDLLWLLPFALTAITFYFVHAVQQSPSGSFERIAFYFLMAASAMVFLGDVGVVIHQRILAILGFPWGALLWTLGSAVFGVATWRAGALPRYVGLTLILLEPLSLLTGLALSPIAPLHERGAYSAGVEKGFAVIVGALGLRSLLRRPASQADQQV